MRATVWCAGRTTALVDDLCAELSEKLTWGEYGVTILPESTLPLDTPDGAEARLEIGSLARIMHQGPDPGRDTKASVW